MQEIIEFKRTPKSLLNKSMLKDSIELLGTEGILNLQPPCNLCLVAAMCSEYCLNAKIYMNDMADKLEKITHEELVVFNFLTTFKIRDEVVRLKKYCQRFLVDKNRLE